MHGFLLRICLLFFCFVFEAGEGRRGAAPPHLPASLCQEDAQQKGKYTRTPAEKHDSLQELATTVSRPTHASSLLRPTQAKLVDRSLFSAVTCHQKPFNRPSANALFVLAQVYQTELPVNLYLFQLLRQSIVGAS